MFTDENTKLQLEQLYNQFQNNQKTISSLFQSDTTRLQKYSIDIPDLNGLYLDYSKNWIDQDILKLLFKIADDNLLDQKISDLFNGAKINLTENRSAMHTALRDLGNDNINLNGINISDLISSTQKKIKDLCFKLHNKQLLGFSNKPIDTIVNIGIGGSDLGPKMVYHALKPYWNKNIKCYFVSNIDPSEISSIISQVDPQKTLFIISSKSFTTQETLANANTVRNWFMQFCEFKDLKHHFIAITSSPDKAIKFGIDQYHILPMWDWVGGRYSLWSAIGLIIALGTSYDSYRQLLLGANKIDKHFQSNSWSENIPVIMALLSIGYINFAGSQSHALLPYSQNLDYFTDYIQQLDMESNGKSVNNFDEIINYRTGPIIWGAPGTNGQHAFHQLLHQGTHIVPCDFIVPVNSDYEPADLQKILVANAFAQAKTLADGYISKYNNFTTCFGNKPSSTLLVPKLDPYYLGMLIALYEHKVFTQGAIWNINSFDQWGVEHGKTLANEIIEHLAYNKNTCISDTLSNQNSIQLDASTYNLINKYKELSNNVS